ncbi:hypothetical protein ACFWE3_12315 [Mycobacteriaceae bacterium NPDC060252]
MTTQAACRTRTILLTVGALALGAGLGMLLWLLLGAILFAFFWSAGLLYGIGVAFGISVLLLVVAVIRLARHRDRLGYRHAVLIGLIAFTAFMGAGVLMDYGPPSHRSMTNSATTVVLDEL